MLEKLKEKLLTFSDDKSFVLAENYLSKIDFLINEIYTYRARIKLGYDFEWDHIDQINKDILKLTNFLDTGFTIPSKNSFDYTSKNKSKNIFISLLENINFFNSLVSFENYHDLYINLHFSDPDSIFIRTDKNKVHKNLITEGISKEKIYILGENKTGKYGEKFGKKSTKYCYPTIVCTEDSIIYEKLDKYESTNATTSFIKDGVLDTIANKHFYNTYFTNDEFNTKLNVDYYFKNQRSKNCHIKIMSSKKYFYIFTIERNLDFTKVTNNLYYGKNIYDLEKIELLDDFNIHGEPEILHNDLIYLKLQRKLTKEEELHNYDVQTGKNKIALSINHGFNLYCIINHNELIPIKFHCNINKYTLWFHQFFLFDNKIYMCCNMSIPGNSSYKSFFVSDDFINFKYINKHNYHLEYIIFTGFLSNGDFILSDYSKFNGNIIEIITTSNFIDFNIISSIIHKHNPKYYHIYNDYSKIYSSSFNSTMNRWNDKTLIFKDIIFYLCCGKIVYSEDHGKSWQDLNLKSNVYCLTEYKEELLAGTDDGIYLLNI